MIRRTTTPAAGTLCLLLCATANAQTNLSTAPFLQSDWVVPIHAAPVEEGRPTELWAVGPDYKASFHDGFVFHTPAVGDEDNAESWRWRTLSVRIGGRDLVTPADLARPTHVRADHRYEYHYPAIIEAYDVRVEGVEQTFVLDRRIAGGGNLEVTGEIETALRAVDTPAAVQRPLAFTDSSGRERIRYGVALAIDAFGRERAVRSRFDSGRVTLTLDGDWLADAAYPVTIDPLIGTQAVESGGGLEVASLDISTHEGITRNKTLVTFARRFSTSDWDAFGVLCDADFGSPQIVFSDATTNYSSSLITCAHLAQDFVMAVQRDHETRILGVL